MLFIGSALIHILTSLFLFFFLNMGYVLTIYINSCLNCLAPHLSLSFAASSRVGRWLYDSCMGKLRNIFPPLDSSLGLNSGLTEWLMCFLFLLCSFLVCGCGLLLFMLSRNFLSYWKTYVWTNTRGVYQFSQGMLFPVPRKKKKKKKKIAFYICRRLTPDCLCSWASLSKPLITSLWLASNYLFAFYIFV